MAMIETDDSEGDDDRPKLSMREIIHEALSRGIRDRDGIIAFAQVRLV